jgi:hypothetical protein
MQNTVYNEYNSYWANVGKYIKTKKLFNLDDVIDVTFNLEKLKEAKYAYYLGDIYNANTLELQKKYFILSRKYIEDLIKSNEYDLVIELGSGWGRNIFYYLSQDIPNNVNIVSGEYTDEGCEIQKYINNKFFKNNKLNVFKFDYNDSTDFFKKIKEQYKFKNVLVYSFWSIEQVTYIKENFLENLLNLCKNIRCVNIEPIGWQISVTSIMKENKTGGRSYYNKNYCKLLKNLELENKIKISNVIPNFFVFDTLEVYGSLIDWQKI